MGINKPYEFSAPFSLCELLVWEDIARESVGGGGAEKSAREIRPITHGFAFFLRRGDAPALG
jgi:hypothetical protein